MAFAGGLYRLSGDSFELVAEGTRSSFLVRDGCTARSLVVSSGHTAKPVVLTELPCATTKFEVDAGSRSILWSRKGRCMALRIARCVLTCALPRCAPLPFDLRGPRTKRSPPLTHALPRFPHPPTR